MLPCRVLPHRVEDGPTNMATDEALLDSVANQPTAAVVRTYAWSESTLSLGYFQSFTQVGADPRWTGRPVVRRPTGGGALWHDREITYAVVVPASHPLARPSTALYQAIHRAIGAAISQLGLPAARRGATSLPAQPESSRPFLCFLDQDPDDIVVGSVKLVGSAQRRRSGAVLQHGSLLLERSPTTPGLLGLADLPGVGAASRAMDWVEVLRASLPKVLGGPLIHEEASGWEHDRADTLRKSCYLEEGWTRRR